MVGLTWWRLLAGVFLPLPLLLIAVLSLPAPRDVRRRVLWFTEQVRLSRGKPAEVQQL